MRRLTSAIVALSLLIGGAAHATMSPLGGRITTFASLLATPLLGRAKPSYLQILNCVNASAALAYVQMFDAAATSGITVGTTPNNGWIPVPVGTFSFNVFANFTNGIVLAATLTPTGNGAPSAGLVCSMTAQ